MSQNQIETPSTESKTQTTPYQKKGKWSPEEDELLSSLVKTFNYKNWKNISQNIPGRTAIQCLHRWTKILQPGLVKGPWTAQEDAKLYEWVKKQGPTKWTLCSEIIPGRSGKQCREHWNNSLNPDVKKGLWSSEEDFLIMVFYKKYDGSWKKIIPIFKNRTENSIKNRFFSQLRKIASSFIHSKEKKFSAKIKLDQLLQYLDIASKKAKEKFLKEKPMNEKELENYIDDIDQKLIKSTQKNNYLSLNHDLTNPLPVNLINGNNNNNNINNNINSCNNIKNEFKIKNNLSKSNHIINGNNNNLKNKKIDNKNIILPNSKEQNNCQNEDNNFDNYDLEAMQKEIFEKCCNNQQIYNIEKDDYDDNKINQISINDSLLENKLNPILINDCFVENNPNIIPTPNNSNLMYSFLSKPNNNLHFNDINSYYKRFTLNVLSQNDMKCKNLMDTLVELEQKVQETQKVLKKIDENNSKINSNGSSLK